ncbi:hypothetical protein CKW48_21830, partial [Bordetella pertussis]
MCRREAGAFQAAIRDGQDVVVACTQENACSLHSTLCRREAGAFQAAIRDGQDVVVACTQENA